MKHLFLCFFLVACGGGGDGYTDEPPYKFARFEFEPGLCAFDSREVHELAALQYPTEYAQCHVLFVGNTLNGEKWPLHSWPSTPRL